MLLVVHELALVESNYGKPEKGDKVIFVSDRFTAMTEANME